MMNDAQMHKAIEDLTRSLVAKIFSYLESNRDLTGHEIMVILTSVITSTMVSSLSHMKIYIQPEARSLLERDIEAFQAAMYTIFNKPETLQ